VLTEANFVVARPRPAPDFLARGLTGVFALEATTINPGVRSDGHVDRLETGGLSDVGPYVPGQSQRPAR